MIRNQRNYFKSHMNTTPPEINPIPNGLKFLPTTSNGNQISAI